MADQQPPPPPPPPPYQQPPYQQPPQKKRRRGCLIPLAIVGGLLVVLIVAAVIAGSGDDDTDDGDSASGGDNDGLTQLEEVTITECGPPDAIGVVYVKGEANNTSTERSIYIIEVAVEDAGGTQIGTGTGFAQNVEPGQVALWQVITDTPSDRWIDGATCRVVDVERDAAP